MRTIASQNKDPRPVVVRPEDKLLLSCALSDTRGMASTRALLERPLDWMYLVATAQRHGLMPLLCWHLKKIGSQFVPAESMAILQDCFERTVARNLHLVQELRRIIHILESDGIQTIPFGAAVLAVSIYEHVALRGFNALECLVEGKHILRAKDLMIRHGYQEEFTLTRGQQVARVRCRKSYGLERTDHVAHLSISGQNDLETFPPRLDIENLRKYLTPISLDGQRILALSPEDLLLTRCAYFVQSYYAPRLVCLSEIARLLGRYPDLDWRRVADRATDLGVRRQLILVLVLIADLFETPLPESVMSCIQADLLAKGLSQEIHARLADNTDSNPGFFERYSVSLKLSDRIQHKIRFLVRLVLTPSWEDCVLVPLPAPFWFLCYVLRPVRLLGKCVGLFRPKKLSIFIPTPMEVVDKMLSLAEVRSEDVVYDLGCGDGRIVITAAKRLGARGLGIDLEPARIAEARANARKEKVTRQVTFLQQTLLEVDFSPATVVMLYLSSSANLMLREKLQQLRPGTRIVSNTHDMGDWKPTKTELAPHAGGSSQIHLWQIGASHS